MKITGFQYFHVGKIKKTKQLRIRPFLEENPTEIRPQLCPAAYIFNRPFLSFAAEESVSWEGTLHNVYLGRRVKFCKIAPWNRGRLLPGIIASEIFTRARFQFY